MNASTLLKLFALATLSLSPTLFSQALASEAFLDAPYKQLAHPRVDLEGRSRSNLPKKSDVLPVIAQQSEVKTQAARGSCSIFSAIALLESMLVVEEKLESAPDLSEEYLQYLIAQHATDDGSTSPANFRALHDYGAPAEEKMPYIGATWKSLSDGIARERCGHIQDRKLANCLTGHRDPALLLMKDEELSTLDADFLSARREAQENRARFFSDRGRFESGIVWGTNEIKETLSYGVPLTLDIEFYYGAWNHRLADELTIGRDLGLWEKGTVTYPERGSLDRSKSRSKPAGHSVVIVGYDDDLEIEYSLKMDDGSTKTFQRKGVYFFKNSWGTTGFGAEAVIEGKTLPGYGMISQDYANEYGQFFRLSL